MLRNTDQGYGFVHIVIHWGMAIMIWAVAIRGLTMTDMPVGFDKLEAYAQHKSVGLTILALAVLRLVWKLANRSPLLPETMKGWERTSAAAAHHLIYLLLFLVPILGYLTSESAPFPLEYFGMFTIPNAGIGEGAAKVMLDVHEWAAKFLLLVVIVHALAALKHHFIAKDDVLKRMIIPAKKD